MFEPRQKKNKNKVESNPWIGWKIGLLLIFKPNTYEVTEIRSVPLAKYCISDLAVD